MTVIDHEEEARLIAQGEKPYSFQGQAEFAEMTDDGFPTGRFYRCYKPLSGGTFAFHTISERKMTPEEMDAVTLRHTNGIPRDITYGEYRKRSTAK